jgi:hypothetical protein
MFKIIYVIGFCLVVLTILFGIVLCAIITIRDAPKDVVAFVSHYISVMFIMFFYLLGIAIGVPFLALNIAGWIINRNTLSIILTVISTGWVGYSVFLWVSHGFVI